jgi:hypothetical protein
MIKEFGIVLRFELNALELPNRELLPLILDGRHQPFERELQQWAEFELELELEWKAVDGT